MNLKYSFFVTLIVIFLLSPLYALEPIIIDDTFGTKVIGRNIEYILDKEKKYTIENISDKSVEWLKSSKDSLALGFNPNPHWFTFTLKNNQKKDVDIYLEISNPLTDYLEVYIPEGKGKYKEIKTGDYLPFNTRDVIDPNFLFHLKLKPNQQLTYYFRIHCPASTATFVPTLMLQNIYEAKFRDTMPIFWIYYGLMIVMVIYNLFIFFSIWDKSYLYLSLFITTWILLQFTLGGHAYQYLWPNSPNWENSSIAFFVSLVQVFWVLFPRTYIDTPKYFPRFNKVMIFSVLIPCSIFTFLSFLSVFLPTLIPYKIMILVVDGYAIYTLSMLLVLSIYGTIKKSRPATYMLLSFGMLMVGAILYLLKSFGALPENIVTQWSMQTGSSLMVILLSLGLADKINTMKNQLAQLNVNLEIKVKERTEELQIAMEELTATNDMLVKARDELWGEMQLAKKIQTVLLPEKPHIEKYDISAFMKPADQVGGDYYDIINVADRDWIVIGDVSGHGVPAGLIMMMVQTAIHVALSHNSKLPPAELLTIINKTITNNIKRLNENKYMTITVLACHENGEFIFSGLHLDIMIYRSREKKVELIETEGMWLGIIEDIENMVDNNMFTLNVNDIMLIYTDGVVESWKEKNNEAEGEMFGYKKLEKILERLGGTSPDNIKTGILKELEGYTYSDDITLVILKRNV